jgi:hypothetical protein
MSEKEEREEVTVEVEAREVKGKIEEAKEEVKADVRSLAEAVKTLAEKLVEAREAGGRVMERVLCMV